MKTWFTISNKASESAAEIDIFDEIGLWGITAKDFATALKDVPADRDIVLRINSPGGAVWDGFTIYNLLAERRERVTSVVLGLAASMASVIMLAGKQVKAADNATIMIHNPWVFIGGESEELRKMADLLDKLRGSLINAYAKKTGKKDDEVSEAMDATTWFTAAEAKDWGLVDEVTESMKVAASFDLTRLGKPAAKILEGVTSTNNQPKKEMKNLIKALVDAKLVASIDASEDTAVAQFSAAFATLTASAKEASDRATKALADLEAANGKLAEQTKASAEAAIESAIKAGKIKDDATVRAKWVEALVRDADGTKAMLDAIEAKASQRGAAPVATAASVAATTAANNRPGNAEVSGFDRVVAAFSKN